MLLHRLFEKINKCYGATNSKIIPIVNIDELDKIDSVIYTNDGLTILKAFTRSNRKSPQLHSLHKMVDSFEQAYGDSTSFLCMLVLSLINKGSRISDKELNGVLNAIPNIGKSKQNRKTWIKTVARHSEHANALAEIFMKDRVTGYKVTDTLPEMFTVQSRSGLLIPCAVFPYFTSPKFRNITNSTVFIENKTVNMEIYQKYVDLALSELRQFVVFCKWYTLEVEEAMSKIESCPVILLKFPDTDKNKYIDDIIVMTQATLLSDDEDVYTGDIGRISIRRDSVILEGFSASEEEIGKYCKSLYDATKQSSDDLRSVKHRTEELMGQKVSTLIISSKTPHQRDEISGVVNDIIRSWHSAIEGGFTTGSLKWADPDSIEFKNILGITIIEIANKIKSSAKNYKEITVDNYEAIRNAIIEAVSFANNHLDVLVDEEIPVHSIDFNI